MTRCVSALVLAALLAGAASAQISFSSSEAFPYTPGEPVAFSVRSTGADVGADDRERIDALIARTGADRTWDFTAVRYDETSTSTTTLFVDYAGLPGAGEFPGADVAVRSAAAGSESYTYGTLTSDAYSVLGVFFAGGAADGRDSVVTYEAGGIRRLVFPYTAGVSVSDEAAVVVRPSPGFSPTVREEAAVVGYGTLVLPTGSYPCLMEERTITVRGAIAGRPVSFATTTYSWTTKDSVAATATNYALPDGRRAYGARYTVPSAGGGTAVGAAPGTAALSLTAAPNPAGGAAALRLTTAAPLDVRVGVWDALGRRVARVWDGPVGAGTTAFALDTSAWAPGLYVARVEGGAAALAVRFVVAR